MQRPIELVLMKDRYYTDIPVLEYTNERNINCFQKDFDFGFYIRVG